jgi:hypothetical protein
MHRGNIYSRPCLGFTLTHNYISYHVPIHTDFHSIFEYQEEQDAHLSEHATRPLLEPRRL